MTSSPAIKFRELMKDGRHNKPLWPLSSSGLESWRQRSEVDIRSALKAKVVVRTGLTVSEKSGSSSGTTLEA